MSHSIHRRLTHQEFMALPENSFEFYSVLPTDPLQLDGEWKTIELNCLAERMLAFGDLRDISEADMDELACGLLMNSAVPLSKAVDWYALADNMAIIYMQQFLRDGSPSRKMRAGRVNFFLRDVLEHGLASHAGIRSRCVLAHPFPWDWLPLEDGELVVDSGIKENFHFHELTGSIGRWRVGLPTQVDVLSCNEFSVTSCFSEGWYLWRRGHSPIFNEHHSPVVVEFDFDRSRYFLDATGCVYCKPKRRPLLRLPYGNAWRARFIDDTLYVFCLGLPYRIFGVCMDDLKVNEINTWPVIIPNDICKIESFFYMIDKMQGKVFSFDESFRPAGERMSFGRGDFKLYDPISLRAHSGSLWVLSWMTSSITRLNPF
jgi:hypothetical protein